MNFNFENIEKDLETLEKIKNVTLENKDKYIEELDKILNKYKKYLEIKDSAKKIIDTILLVQLLKEEQLKITQDQNKKSILYKKQIEESIEKLKKINAIIIQIENEEQYINSEIIELLNIEKTIENLKQIIKHNKKVNNKKNRPQIEIEQIEEIKEEIKEEPKQIKQKKKKKKKSAKKQEELVFTCKEEIIDYVCKKYEIELPENLYNKTEEEMETIINILEQKQFKNIDIIFVNNLFKYATPESMEKLLKILKESKLKLEDLDEILVFDEKFEYQVSNINDICSIPFYETREQQKKAAQLDEKIKLRILRNTLTLLVYEMVNIKDTRILSKKINVEYIDRIIECGFGRTLKKDANELFDFFEIPHVENATSKKMNDVIYKRYFGLIIDIEDTKISNQEYDQKIKEKVEFEIKKRGLMLQDDLTNMMIQICSKNEILRKEDEINKKSKEHIEKSMTNVEALENPYIKYLDSKYLTKKEVVPIYVIPIDKNLFGIDNILISRNKVLRLIGEHIIEGDEIQIETVINCIFYNMIITDAILENAKEIMTEELKKVEEYPKTNIKK